MTVFGVNATCGENGSTELYAVVARDKDEAEMLVSQELSHQDDVELEVSDLEDLLCKQYEGLAVLGIT